MKKWEYKVACYSYDDASSCWVSIFDEKESQKLEELIAPLGDEGWELINITPELALPVKEHSPYELQTIRAGGESGRGVNFFGKLRPGGGGDNVTTISIPQPAGGFDVKAYRAFFKREKSKKLFG
jgi:hypothetical protein